MSQGIKNDTGCIVTISHMTGDVLCRWPGAECDCLMQRIDESYKEEEEEVDSTVLPALRSVKEKEN